jgi:hypothetical protein
MSSPDVRASRRHALLVPGLGDHLRPVREAHTQAALLMNADIVIGKPQLSTVVMPSIGDRGYSTRVRVAEIADLIQGLTRRADGRHEPVSIVGTRLGGDFALLAAGEVAKAAPDAIQSVVLVGTRTHWAGDEVTRSRLLAMSGLATTTVDLVEANWQGGARYADSLAGKVTTVQLDSPKGQDTTMMLEGVPHVVLNY